MVYVYGFIFTLRPLLKDIHVPNKAQFGLHKLGNDLYTSFVCLNRSIGSSVP